ncbi:histidine kinase dimerization/phospho-acceptor domain-containing protein, partial [Natronomonas sp.]|uniref:sensor histidine kinase n=1 Tax=Natronomonas sp. TaxID=2184060 RepID=UPI0039765CEC
MPRKRLLWRLYRSYLIVTVLSLIIAGWYGSRSLKDFFYSATESDLKSRVHLIEGPVFQVLRKGELAAIDSLVDSLARKSNTRITVILPDGQVIGESEEEIATMKSHSQRPEFLRAMDGEIGVDIRKSQTLQRQTMYVAIPLMDAEDRMHGVLRTSLPVEAIDDALADARFKIAMGGLVVIVFAAITTLLLSWRISRPLEEMKRVAQRFARGDFNVRMPVSDSEEIGGLAEAMNQMAEELERRIGTMDRRRDEERAVLTSMVEGVVAVDEEERVINMNKAAGDLFGVSPNDVRGRSIQEIVRNTDLEEFITRTLQSHEPVEEQIVIHSEQPHFLHVRGSVLKNPSGRSLGALVVLNDVTYLRRLENVRRDFVANVSHELKTPITSIKGFVETLLEGAFKREEAERFLRIIARHADRLQAIVEDLLSLSRIEQESDKEELPLERTVIKEVLSNVMQLCEPHAEAKHIDLKMDCAENVTASVNVPLIEQAILNLIDNAIKYSDDGSMIEVRAHPVDLEVAISVKDYGCGIPAENLPRLFERFYR